MENNGMIETHQQFLLHRRFFHVIDEITRDRLNRPINAQQC